MNVISAGGIAVPDQEGSRYCLPDHAANLRRALWAIEEGMGGRVEWEAFAGLGAEKVLEIHATVHRGPWSKRLAVLQKRLRAQ